MRFAVNIPPFTDANSVLNMAVEAERAGWDAVFLWDHVQWDPKDELDVHDPWTLLGAIAARTDRVLLGTAVTPIARRRPWILAKQLVTLDHLSGGRAMLGVGLGAPDHADFGAFGDIEDPKERAVILDDGLELIEALLTGDPVHHLGPGFTVDAQLRPSPVQKPRPPIFAAGFVPNRRPLERALRYDGFFPLGGSSLLSPQELAEFLNGIERPDNWDVFTSLAPGYSVAEWEEAGATWLVESAWPSGDWEAELTGRIKTGPPT